MDARDLTRAGLAPPAAQLISGYLADLDAHLPAGPRIRKAILLELADGLSCAVTERVRAGQSPADAAQAAIAESGDPNTVAAAFARQLGLTASHRLGLGLVLTGPLVGLSWVVASTTAGPDWLARILQVLAAMPQFPLILPVTVLTAMLAITGSGRAARLVTLPGHVVTGAALIAVIGCVMADVSLLTTALLSHRLTSSGAGGLPAIAVAASMVRLSAVALAGRRIARLRAGAN
jgi:hypothetical protein